MPHLSYEVDDITDGCIINGLIVENKLFDNELSHL